MTTIRRVRSFLGSLERIVSDDYVPTVQDILHARLTTTGVIETTFTFKGYNFRSDTIIVSVHLYHTVYTAKHSMFVRLVAIVVYEVLRLQSFYVARAKTCSPRLQSRFLSAGVEEGKEKERGR